MTKSKKPYHHGNLAESLLQAVDELATKFGLEAVTLRACAKSVGVSPSSAFRHYADKRALLTAFATKAKYQLSESMDLAKQKAEKEGENQFAAVGLAYIAFALEKPAFFRAMWRAETSYTTDEDYIAATNSLIAHLQGGFGDTIADDDPSKLSPEELLAWSAVHGLANLFIDGPVDREESNEHKLETAKAMIRALSFSIEKKQE